MIDEQDDDRIAGALRLARAAAALAVPRRDAAARGEFSLEGTTPDPRPETIPEVTAIQRGLVRDDAPVFLAELGATLAADALPRLASALDEVEDREEGALAVLLGLLGAALRAEKGRHWFHFWTSETLRRELPRDAARGVAASIRREIEQRITLGINLRGRSDAEFLAAVRQVDRHEAGPSESAALDALRVLLQCSSFSAADLPRAVRLAVGHDGAVTANAAVIGLVAGAYYGAARLREDWPELLPSFGEEGEA